MVDISVSPEVEFRQPAMRRKRQRMQRLTLQKASYSEEVLSSTTTSSTSDSASSSPSFSPDSSAEDLAGLEEREIRKELGESEGKCVSYGCASVIGRRREMEDAVRAELDFARGLDSRSFDYFGVFDGHGGAQVAEACGERMHWILGKEIGGSVDEVVDWEGLMGRCFEKMDSEVADGDGGSTAVVAVVGREEIVVANCGDSRAVICRSGTAVPLTVDHKPDRPDELARIEAEGGKVINWNGYRVSGVLATSRSIGDKYLKPYVIPTPEVTVSTRTKDDEFLILASDGLWDVVSNEVACQVTRRCLEGRIHRDREAPGGASCASNAASVLADLALARGSADNVSAVVVELKRSRRSFL